MVEIFKLLYIRSYSYFCNCTYNKLLYTGSDANKTGDSTDWQLTGSLIGGGFILIIVLVTLAIACRIPRPRGNDAPGNDM